LVDSEHSIETRCYSYLPESCKQAYQSHPASSLAKRGSSNSVNHGSSTAVWPSKRLYTRELPFLRNRRSIQYFLREIVFVSWGGIDYEQGKAYAYGCWSCCCCGRCIVRDWARSKEKQNSIESGSGTEVEDRTV
jgi:hypothetical protein